MKIPGMSFFNKPPTLEDKKKKFRAEFERLNDKQLEDMARAVSHSWRDVRDMAMASGQGRDTGATWDDEKIAGIRSDIAYEILTERADPKVKELIDRITSKIIEGEIPEGVEIMIKNAPTYTLNASPDRSESRYRPGSKLYTYTGIDKDGKPIKENYGGGVAEIKANSVIIQNIDPLIYPNDYYIEEVRGKPIQGYYNDENEFIPLKSEAGLPEGRKFETLFNEYVSDTTYVADSYGEREEGKSVPIKEGWTTQYKKFPSAIIQNPGIKHASIVTKGGRILLEKDGYVVIDFKSVGEGKNKIVSTHPIMKEFLEKGYIKTTI